MRGGLVFVALFLMLVPEIRAASLPRYRIR